MTYAQKYCIRHFSRINKIDITILTNSYTISMSLIVLMRH